MAYEKFVLSEDEAKQLYREDLILGDDGRIVFRKMRYFQEFLGASAYEDDYKVISKSNPIKVGLELPGYVPMMEPLENWFQVAMRRPVDSHDPLNLEARYKGFLPAYFVYDSRAQTGMIRVEDDPEFDFVDYALFIYDRADYGNFVDEVQRVLGKYLHRGFSVVRDRSGNTILVSDSLTEQAMLLMPIALIEGGREYMKEAWRNILKA